MASFRYRAIAAGGIERRGSVDAQDMAGAVDSVRRLGVAVIEVTPAPVDAHVPGSARVKPATVIAFVGELAVMLRAGLALDRALALAIGNIQPARDGEAFLPLLADVREGRPLSGAMQRCGGAFSPAAIAMTEAGEANGRLADALATLAGMLERDAELRRTIGGAMIYPAGLMVIAVSVILIMLLFVVPQFEGLLGGAAAAHLPFASRAVLGASALLREQGLLLLLVLGVAVLALRLAVARPSARLAFDRLALRVPLAGPLVQRIDTARFARTLGALVDGEVPLPNAVALAERTVANRHIGAAVAEVAEGIRRGGGLSGPLGASGVLPDMAMGFIRTGEETSELGLMLGRLADVLDRDVRNRLARLVAILTPAITVIMGAAVTAIIAAVMSAILGFNEVALSQ